MEERPQCRGDHLRGVQATQAILTSIYRTLKLRGRTLFASVAQAVLADDYCRADLTFAMVVVRGHAGGVQEGEQLVAVFADAMAQAIGVGVVVRRVGQFAQALVNQPEKTMVEKTKVTSCAGKAGEV